MGDRQNVCWQHSRRVWSKVLQPRCFPSRSEPSTVNASSSSWNKCTLLLCSSNIPASPTAWPVPPLCPDRRPKEYLQSEPDTPSWREPQHLWQHSIKVLVPCHKTFFHHFTRQHKTAGVVVFFLVVHLFLIYASGNDWQCFTYAVQKPTRLLVSLASGAGLWCGQNIQVWIPALSLTHCRNLVKSCALLNKMGIIIILTSEMCTKALLINVCKDFEIPRWKTKCIIWIHETQNNVSME